MVEGAFQELANVAGERFEGWKEGWKVLVDLLSGGPFCRGRSYFWRTALQYSVVIAGFPEVSFSVLTTFAYQCCCIQASCIL